MSAKNFLYKLAAVLSLFALTACASTPKTDFDPNIDFSKYTSFQWEYAESGTEIEDPIYDSPLFEKKLEFAISELLLDRGLTGSAEPDMVFKYHLADKKRRNNRYFNVALGYGRYSRHSNWSIFAPHLHRFENDEVVVIVDAHDARTQELIWRGWTSTVRRTRPLNQAETKNLAIKILSGFPVQ